MTLPLHHRRKELDETARQELAGISFWSESFSSETRTRLLLKMRKHTSAGVTYFPDAARTLLLESLGRLSLRPGMPSADDDIFRFLIECADELVPSVVEAYGRAIDGA